MSDAILRRAHDLLSRPDAWLEADGAAYRLRLSPDRRRRPALSLSEADFFNLAQSPPGLAVRPAGGWRRPLAEPPPRPVVPGCRPGVIEGQRTIMDADGQERPLRANLGETPIAWLARRRDASGRPWLSPAEAAAGERLRLDAEIAARGQSLTMRWDALPRAGAGGGVDATPGDRALAAGRRVARALGACGPHLAPVVEAICVRGSALQLAERDLGLRRRQGKIALKAGLQALAAHYGIGA